MENHNWTKDEIDKLIELYPDNKNKDIANLLNINNLAITNKGRRLNLKKSKEHKGKMIAKRNKMVTRDLTYETLKNIASKYKTRGEFQRLDGSAYTTARIAGLLDDICSHMIKGNYSIPQLILWCIIESLNIDTDILYNTRQIIKPYELDIYIPKYKLAFEYDGKTWHLNNNNNKDEIKNNICLENNIILIRLIENSRDYIKDIKNQLINNIDMINKICNRNIITEDIFNIDDDLIYNFVNSKIDDEKIFIDIISKYENYCDFRKNEIHLYQKLLNRGLLEKYTKNLKRNIIYWTEELIIKEINKYEYLSDFIENSFGCYIYIKRNKLDNLIKILKRKKRIHNIDDVKKEITKYTTLSDFREKSSNYYIYIKKHKLYDLIKHLKRLRKN